MNISLVGEGGGGGEYFIGGEGGQINQTGVQVLKRGQGWELLGESWMVALVGESGRRGVVRK